MPPAGAPDEQDRACECACARRLPEQQEGQRDAVHRLKRRDDARGMRREEMQRVDEQRMCERGARDAEHDKKRDLRRRRNDRREDRERQQADCGTCVLPERDRAGGVAGGERAVADRQQGESQAGQNAPRQALHDAIFPAKLRNEERQTTRDEDCGRPFAAAQCALSRCGFQDQDE